MALIKITAAVMPLIRLGIQNPQFSRYLCIHVHHKRYFENTFNKNCPNQKAVVLDIESKFWVPCQTLVRRYAKNKDKKKEKVKKRVAIDERLLGEILPVADIKEEMQRSIDRLKEGYIHSLSLRSTTGAIENLPVSFEGKNYDLQELAQVVRKDVKTVIVNMAAFPQAIQAVLKSLQKSGMNLNPQQDGTSLFIPIPRVTAEHREQLAKNAKTLFIECRDNVKKVQVKYEKKLKNDSSIPQDTMFSAQQQLNALAGEFISTANSLMEVKLKELVGK